MRRRDHWFKPIGFLLLTIYWFNPLMWVGIPFSAGILSLPVTKELYGSSASAKKKRILPHY
ncbi:MAG: hypothetical protein ACYDG2_03795 [Ruminiclostridium sp.]